LLTVGVIALLIPSSAVIAKEPPQQADPLKLNVDVPVVIVNMVKRDKIADFEAGWAMIKQEIDASTRPEVKEFGATLAKVFKVDGTLVGQPAPGPTDPAVYLLHLDPPSKTQSYSPTSIIYELLHKNGAEGGISRARADEIFAKLCTPSQTEGQPCNSVYQQILVWPLVKS
jgi:hypothetical protein